MKRLNYKKRLTKVKLTVFFSLLNLTHELIKFIKMKVYICDIFMYDEDDEYGYIIPSSIYKDTKVFDQKVKALNYLRDIRKDPKRHDVDESEIIEQDI